MVGSGKFCSPVQPELLEDARHVNFDGRLADRQAIREFLVPRARRGVLEDFALPLAQTRVDIRRQVRSGTIMPRAHRAFHAGDEPASMSPDATVMHNADGLQKIVCARGPRQNAADACGQSIGCPRIIVRNVHDNDVRSAFRGNHVLRNWLTEASIDQANVDVIVTQWIAVIVRDQERRIAAENLMQTFAEQLTVRDDRDPDRAHTHYPVFAALRGPCCTRLSSSSSAMS